MRNLKKYPITTKELSDFLAAEIAKASETPLIDQPIPNMRLFYLGACKRVMDRIDFVTFQL